MRTSRLHQVFILICLSWICLTDSAMIIKREAEEEAKSEETQWKGKMNTEVKKIFDSMSQMWEGTVDGLTEVKSSVSQNTDKQYDKAVTAMKDAQNELKSLWTKMEERAKGGEEDAEKLKQYFQDEAKKVTDKMSTVYDEMGSNGQQMKEKFNKWAESFDGKRTDAEKYIMDMQNSMNDCWKDLSGKLEEGINGKIPEKIKEGKEKLKKMQENVGVMWQDVKSNWGKTGDQLAGKMDEMQSSMNNVWGSVKDFYEEKGYSWSQMSSSFKDQVGSLSTSIKDGIGSMGNYFKSFRSGSGSGSASGSAYGSASESALYRKRREASDESSWFGKYKLESSENFEAFLRAIEIPSAMIAIASKIKPDFEFSKNGDEYVMKFITTFQTRVIKFKLGEEFQQRRFDGKKIKSLFTKEGDKIYEVSSELSPNGKTIKVIRDFSEKNLVKVMTKIGDVVATRIYRKA